MPIRPALAAWLLALVTAVPALAQPAPPRVDRFSPTGVVKVVRQVTAHFTEAMVPLGDPRPAAQVFDIACPEPGRARWVDARDWVYDFDRDLPAGVRCTFRLRAGLRTLDGREVGGRREFAFSTGGPSIKSTLPRAGSTWIDEEQAFVLVLDAEPAERTLQDHVWFKVDGLAERVGARLVTGADRTAILDSRATQIPKGAPTVVVQARRRFPNGARVTLVWGKGVATASGVATDQDATLDFGVRREFTVSFTCERENKAADCIPVTPMRLEFSAPVTWAEARRIVLDGPAGQRWPATARDEGQALHHAVTFAGPFPEMATFRVVVPADLRDDAGRTPGNAGRFPLAVKTAAFPPLAKFSARFGLVERADPVLPVTLRRLEPEVRTRLLRADRDGQSAAGAFIERVGVTVFRITPKASGEIVPWLKRVAAAKRESSVFGPGEAALARTLALPKPGGPDAFEVVGIPLARPGLYVVELESPRLGASLLGRPASMYVPTAALVTNLSVHFKQGTEASLVWVTTLDRGQPVTDARVTIQDCKGAVVWSGATDGSGLARVPALDAPSCGSGDWGEDFQQIRAIGGLHQGLFVIAQKLDDLSFVHSSWVDGIETWRFGLASPHDESSLAIHTILDRPLFRAGETVHMKHVLRRRALAGLAQAKEGERPAQLVLRHVGSDQKYELPLSWDGRGIAETTWAIPAGAKLGRYEVTVVDPPKGSRTWPRETTSARFQVEEFRIPFMKGSVKPPAEPQVAVATLPLDVSVQYLAGGGARRLPVTLRSQLQPRSVAFPGFDGFAFASGPVKEGVSRRAQGHGDDEDDAEEGRERVTVHQRDQLVLDDAGTGRATVANLRRVSTPRDLLAELEFRDAAGEVQTVASRIPLWPASRLVGIKPDAPYASGKDVKARVAVVDLAGRPVAGAAVQVDAFERKLYSHRKRLVGGFYAYEHVQEVRRVGLLCQGLTLASGVFVCEGRAPITGHLILQATAMDPAGRATWTQADTWVVGDDASWWFDVRDSDRMDVLPERRRYEPGDTARFQVRSPFQEATALVTVEREGVLEAVVRPLAGREPVVEVPITPGHAPNVFVSVLAVRGRVGGVKPTALVDLGRPAFKLGIAEILVGWRAHELKVTVTADRTTYRVRERARVRIAVQAPEGPLPADGEVAVAAVDEGLLELAANPSWSLLDAMMQRRGYGVATATAQMHVVGKRHFGLKALPQGGGGGRQTTRELFDTLLFWSGRVRLDARGEATVEVPLNDSLTSFRVVAVATAGSSLFGTGALTIRSTQDLMVLPGVAPLVREGDRFTAEVTLRNTTDRPMPVTVRAHTEPRTEPRASEPGHPRPDPIGRSDTKIALAPGEARTVGWDVVAPVGATTVRYEFEATAGGNGAPTTDRVVVTQQVVPAVQVQTYQSTLTRWRGQPERLTVERPADAVPGRGGVMVDFRPTLVDGLDTVRDWMRRYPYTCFEQRVSRAVALRDPQGWRDLMQALPAYLDGDGMVKYFPLMREGSEMLTAYVLAIAHEGGWSIEDGSRTQMLGALAKFVEGRLARRSALSTPDLTLRKLSALETLARYGNATPDLVSNVRAEPNLWPTSAVLDWWSVVHRVPALPGRAARLDEAERIVRARLNLQATTMGFSTEASDGLWWLMTSADTNAVRLVAHLLEVDRWRDDLPRIVRGALGRQRRGAWDLTVANAWGVLALEKFSRTHERTPVAGASTAALGAASRRVEWSAAPRGGAVSLPWPAGREDVVLQHDGAGQPWMIVQAQAAIPLAGPLSSGFRIARTVTPVERRDPARWSRGDLLRVRLEVESQADMTWVVVDDPLAGGASHVGRGLQRESTIATGGERESGNAWPAYVERPFQAFRAYYEWVPKGRFTVEYTVRLNQAGRFVLPPTRVEALYAPEMFGALPNPPLEVQP